MARVLIIGAGLAGVTVARELRTLNPQLAVTLVTQDDGHFYPKPQLSTSLRTGKQPDDLIALRAEALIGLGIEMLTQRTVVSLDVAKQQVELSDHTVLPYDELVLATGASPFVPPMEGVAEAVLTVNHLDDYRRFRDRLVPDQPVLVVGGGLIGVEFAADLTGHGHPVHVVDPGPGPLPRLLPPGAGKLLAAALTKAGATFHWGRTVKSLAGNTGAYVATLDDGTELQAGTVLSAVGLRPQVALAREAGLPVNRGVLVDDHLLAAPHIHALGDCAELPGGVYLPFIKPIGEQAKFVARQLAEGPGGAFPLGNYAIAVKVPMWPTQSTTPHPDEAGEWEEELSETGSLSKLLSPAGQVLRVVGTGDRAAEVRAWLDRVPALGATPAPR